MSPTPDAADRTLRDLLRVEGRLSFERATEILTDLTQALVQQHAAGRAHGAITPQSIRLDADGRARLGPPAGDRLAMGLMPPAYLAPEVIDGEPMTPASDVYTLGLLGWEMLVGQAPWAGESVAEVVTHQREADLPRLTTLRPGVPRPLLLAVEGALHKTPGDRWRSAVEMLSELRRASGTPHSRASDVSASAAAAAAAATAPALPVSPPMPRRERVATVVPVEVKTVRRSHAGRKFALAALVLAVLIAGGAALAAMQGRHEKQVVTQPWLDSITTSTAGGVVITDDTTSSAARVRINHIRDSLARMQALAAPAYPPAYAPGYAPASVDTAAASALARNDALARAAAANETARLRAEARAQEAAAQAAADSARQLRSTVPTASPTPRVDSGPATPRPAADSAPKPKPKTDSTRTKPDTMPAAR